MTANGYIRRGPMAADVFEQQFTRIHNAVFRDKRMSYKAKGIFGLISTHRDGFGLSIESLTSFSTDGTSAVRTGLNELEEFGYLQRDQQRLDGPTKENPKAKKGSFGSVEYFITDMPDGLIISVPAPEGGEGGTPSSDPSCENRTTEENPSSGPSCDFPHADEPHAEDHRRKKTNPQKNISLSGSPSSPEPQESAPAETKARETAAPEDNSAPATAEVPAPRDGHGDDGQRAELLEMLLGLPGRDRMNREEAADMLLPLAVDAVAIGWTVPKLRSHLARGCDPDRVFNVVAVYRSHLKKLPQVPAGAGGHPAAAAPECSKCNGSGLAEDPETFLPTGPCECRRAPALAS
ncbi:hypothetical protein QZH56_37055 (plasmid) [Streptomyces olivoreticuli]|uniref:hypothetical protein n=1 Tax=Streptomyces olivoreticuli TaxID=68246 RepID=UPI0026590D69|nr:hypothetical protein [Streptomyces olivoreticuli]WKK27800.1 hypothetical protein QZH56_37055 [Streptomyces olivoreticuli]